MSTEKKNVLKISTEFGVYYCEEGDIITNQLIEYGAHARNELNMVLDHIDPNDIVLDIGGHIGTYAVPIAQKLSSGSGCVYTFEATYSTYNLLLQNIEINRLSQNIIPFQGLLSDQDNLKFSRANLPDNSGATYYLPEIHGAEIMPTKDIRRVLQSMNIDHVDFVKLDIEGMEFRILKALHTMIEISRPILYIEICEDHLNRLGDSSSDIEAMLKGLDYTFYVNSYKRNSIENKYVMKKIDSLDIGRLFDVLALPKQVIKSPG